MKVAKRKPLKWLKKTLLSAKASKKEDKQANPIEVHEEDSPTSLKKSHGQPLKSNKKKNPTTNNVVHKCNVPTKKGTTPWTRYKSILCITLYVKTITNYTLGKILIHTKSSNNVCVDHARKWNMTLIWIKKIDLTFKLDILYSNMHKYKVDRMKTNTFNILIIPLLQVIKTLKENLHYTKNIGIWKEIIS
jgi:hypothetical protein